MGAKQLNTIDSNICQRVSGHFSPQQGVGVGVAGGMGERGTPVQYLYRYVPPNRVVILGLLISKGVSIFKTFP